MPTNLQADKKLISSQDVADIRRFVSHNQIHMFSLLKSVKEEEESAVFKTTTNSKQGECYLKRDVNIYLMFFFAIKRLSMLSGTANWR